MWTTWQTDANPQHWITVSWTKVRRKKKGFSREKQEFACWIWLSAATFFVFQIWCRVADVPSLWCAGWLFCFTIPVVCGQTHKCKREGGSCVPCLGRLCTALGRLWRMQVGKQIQKSPGRQICVWESFPRQRNLCGFLSACSINLHSSHWKGC